MANTSFAGPVRSKNGFQSIGPGAVVALTAATDLTVAAHAGRLLTMDPVGTPTAITLPTINASADAAVAGANDQTIQAQLELRLKFFLLMNLQVLSQQMEQINLLVEFH